MEQILSSDDDDELVTENEQISNRNKADLSRKEVKINTSNFMGKIYKKNLGDLPQQHITAADFDEIHEFSDTDDEFDVKKLKVAESKFRSYSSSSADYYTRVLFIF